LHYSDKYFVTIEKSLLVEYLIALIALTTFILYCETDHTMLEGKVYSRINTT